MKRVVLVVFVALFSLGAMAEDPRSTKWESAAASYASGDYATSARTYEELVKEGARSWELYYNLGAAYFKDNQLGRAVLNFERAAVLDPGNEDVEHNLAVAQSRTVDKIESIPQFFVLEWITATGGMMGADGWAIVGVVLLAVALGFTVLWRLRKSRFASIVAVVAALLMAVSFLYAHSAYSTMGQSDSAIVINTASVVRSSPDSAGKELFVLHEGSKVTIVDQIGSWLEVRIASGGKGWVTTTDIEKI